MGEADKEVEALTVVVNQLSGLDKDEQDRIIEYVINRFGYACECCNAT